MWEFILQLDPYIIGDNNKAAKDNDRVYKSKVN